MADIRQSLMLNVEQMGDLADIFNKVDSDGSGYITVSELGEALERVGLKLPGYEVRNIISKYDSHIKDDKIDLVEFQALYAHLKNEKDLGRQYKKVTTRVKDAQFLGSGTSTSEAQHHVRSQEQVAFSNWINRNLADDDDCKKYLPLNPETHDLYVRSNDGILLCKMINKSQPGTIDERTINKGKLSIYQIHENLTLALNSAQSIGCNIVNIGPEDIQQGKPHLVLGLLWQIIRIGLLGDINLHDHPNLAALLRDGETLEEFMKLSPEQILIRWVNYHLEKSGCGRQISNFQGDIKDSIAYIHLLHQIAPRDSGVTTGCENVSDTVKRAEAMLNEADKIGCRSFVTASDVVSGNYKLNLAFVANLFNTCPALDQEETDFEIPHEETREEKMYRNWMNSMGVSPYVNYLYNDLTDGLIIFQLYDIIQPGVVDWDRVIKKFQKMRIMLEKIENCNYAVELGKKCNFSLVGIDGKDLYDGNETLTLALVWQLMRAYTLSILSKLANEDDGRPIIEKEIVAWANEKLASASKPRKISSFNDPSISDGMVVIDLVDAIKPGAINYSSVNESASTNEEKLQNAKYAISSARKIGARIYALPEDIQEVKSKMVMTIFACLMIRDFQPSQK